MMNCEDTCGCMLFLINAALVGITIFAVKKNDGFTYPGYLIYVMALYAFYSVITAVIFVEKVREVNKHIPILFVSAKDDLPSKQKGFQLGIDDYMVKPIELAEFEMRVRALLRRANIEMERKLIIGNLVLDADAMMAEIDG